MGNSVGVGIDEEGQACAVKRASDAAGADRLAHEAHMLAASRHPGVVALLDHRIDGGGAVVELAWAGGGDGTTAVPSDLDEVVHWAAALAATLADLHRRGVAHRRLRADHVVFDTARAPLLTGFAEATEHADDADRAGDVAALAATVRELLARLGPVGAVRSLRSGATARAARLELALAWAEGAGEPANPTAAGFARALADLAGPTAGEHAGGADAGGAATTSPPRPGRSPRGGARRPRRAVVVAGTVVALAGAVLLMAPVGAPSAGSMAGGAGSTPSVAGTLPGGSGTSVAMSPPATAPPTGFGGAAPGLPGGPLTPAPDGAATTAAVASLIWPAATEGPPSPEPSRECPQPELPMGADGRWEADVDGDGCDDLVVVEQPGVLAVGGRRFGAGLADDLASIGDWDCDGVSTPALVRPSTGEVFVFEAWPTAAGPIDARAVPLTARVSGFAAPPPGCGGPRVLLVDGTEVDLGPAGAAP